jgi:photosystem II stability/assembly factor-like uncharacterized protein
MRISIAGGALVGCLLLSPIALANGRFPSAQLLVTDPSNPDRLLIRATYGVLTSADRGCTWRWLCEAALGYRGTEDPMIGITADGSVIVGIFDGLVTSRDHGCNWSREGPMERRYVVDLAVHKGDATQAIAATSTGDVNGGYENRVWRTTDSARSWQELGPQLPRDTVLITLDTAPSDSRHIYMTGVQFTASDGGPEVGEGLLMRSRDDGQNWDATKIPGATAGFDPYLSAVHPNDPLKIYVRLRGPDDPSGVVNRLVYSPDGGETWQQIFEAPADMLGLALSPDGSRIVLGLGDSRTLGRTRPVTRDALGLFSASTTDHRFVLKRPGQIGCLTWSAEGIYFCADSFVPVGDGFELGLTTDEGTSSKKVMHLAGVEGPLQCPTEATASQACSDTSEWTRTCQNIGRCGPSGEPIPYPRGETCAPGPNSSGGPDGGPFTDEVQRPPSPPPHDELNIDKGCSVSASGRTVGCALVGLLALAALVTTRRKPRRRAG